MVVLSIYLLHSVIKYNINRHEQHTQHALIQCISFSMPDCYKSNEQKPHNIPIGSFNFEASFTEFQLNFRNIIELTICCLRQDVLCLILCRAGQMPRQIWKHLKIPVKNDWAVLKAGGVCAGWVRQQLSDAYLSFHLTYQVSSVLEL